MTHLLSLSLFFRNGRKLLPAQIGSARRLSVGARVGGPVDTTQGGLHYSFVWIFVLYILNVPWEEGNVCFQKTNKKD